MALAILQSLLYAIGSIWFVDELRRTRISKVSYLVAIFFALNPTLSLNTIAVGYELPVVALSLIALAALLRYFLEKKSSVICFEVLIATISLTIATFMQPRLLIIAIVFFLLWALSKYKLELVSIFIVITFGSLAVAPAVLAVRNNLANGFFAISTNLGITMQLGAGPEASGGYTNTREGVVECPALEGNPAEVDRALVSCVIGWYVDNPERGLKLFWNKSRFFWSPWFGPEANGTMARNPWIQIHPFKSTAQTQEGFNLIYGVAGRVVSWLWMCISLIFLIYGLIKLWRFGDLERLVALISGSIIILNLVSSMITIGDHRFRIPSMGVSLFLQAFGLFSFLSRQNSGSSYQSKLVTWPGLLRMRKTTESS
jgi:hypothetical protein